MSKSFMYFICGLAILTVFYLGVVAALHGFTFGSNPFNTWTEKLGLLIFLISFLLLYKLFKMIEQVKQGMTSKEFFFQFLLVLCWMIIPLIYNNSVVYDKLECVEVSITHSGGPARCYSPEELLKIRTELTL